ncbi:Crp/Fnr family transcriptional regulator [Aquiflexum sp.]|uniref:Crp/Fnr family transcriptional regulator n=1 Tax=Aquiflexum sp. TaxID=1872584 RepID=UPI003593CCE6
MRNNLIQYCNRFIRLTEEEENLIKEVFRPKSLLRKEYLLESGQKCDFIAFVEKGVIRHFHIKDGNEITCDISLSNTFLTDFRSFNQQIPSEYFFQALKDTNLFLVNKMDLNRIYEESKNIASFGRIMAEQVAQRTVDIAQSIASDKPEERLNKLLQNRPQLFQEVPLRYIAHLIGISPESLSRLRARQKP